jgi:hypothetical protein
MHGCFERRNIVLTEDDYLNYSQNFPLVESFIKGIFASRLVLFIGFSFTDINLKYILQKVESVLGKKKQPAYILLTDDFNEMEKDYLRKKRIQPIYYDEIKDYIESTSDISILKKLSHEKGNNLLKFLQLVEEPPFEKEALRKLSIIKQMYQSISPFQDFGFIMPSIYERLEPFKVRDKNLKNSYDFGYFQTRANCLFIENPVIIELLRKLTDTDSDGKTQRKIKTLQELQFVGSKIDIDKKIIEITNGAITNESEYNEMIVVLEQLNSSMISCVNNQFNIKVNSEDKTCNCLACRYNRFEFDKLFELFGKVELTNQEISSGDNATYNLLLKGYIANKIGLPKIAYKAFIEASESAKNHEKPILLFISKYNLKYIYSSIYDDDGSREIAKEYSESIDLQDLLNGLKVPREVRNELENVKTEKHLHDYTDTVRKSRDKIIYNHNLFENGGSTTGSGEDNVYNLITNFVVIHQFYEKNCLIDTEYNLFKEFIEICFEGIIYNYTTSQVKQKYWSDNYTRLDSIDPFFIQSVVLYANSDRLLEILSKLGNKKITIEDSEKRKKIIDCVINFLKSFYEKPSWGGAYANKEVLNRADNISPFGSKCQTIFTNFILLLGKIEFTDAEFSGTIQPLLYFLSVETFLYGREVEYWQFYLETNIRRYQKERQKQLLSTFLSKKNTRKSLIAKTAYEIQQIGSVLFDDVSEIEKIYDGFDDRNGDTIFELYPISSIEVQNKIKEIALQLLNFRFDLQGFYRAVFLKVLPVESFLENAIKEVNPYLNKPFDNESLDFTLTNFLYFIGRNCIDTSGDLFRPFIENNEYIQWLFRFDGFDYSNFKNEWFGYRPTSTFLPQMAKNKEVKKHFKQYLKSIKDDDDFQHLSKIYIEYFL